MNAATQPARKSHSTLIAAVVGVGVLALAGWGIANMMGGKSGGPKKPPKITVVEAPPPPPPPPPKFEKKPDPPKEQKEVKIDQPQPKPQQAPPPSPDLKMEGAAGDGPSAFGAGKITSDDLSKFGNGTGGGGGGGLFNPFRNYSNLLKGELERHLAKNNALRRRNYALEVRVWVTPQGALKRYELAGSSDDSDIDDAIRRALASMTGFSEAPPPNMPQPIRLRVITKG